MKNIMIDKKIFWPSFIFIAVVALFFSFKESSSLDTLNGIFDVIVAKFSWGYIWYSILITLAGVWFCCSKYGGIVMGDPKEKSQFTLFEYASIIIAMGLGSTIMRTGSIQWVPVAMNPPFGIEPLSDQAIMWGNAYGMFLWSFQTFAIFVMTAPAMGYLIYVRKAKSMRISEVCRCVFGDKFTNGIGGKLIDILFLVSIIAGAAVTVGLGTPLVTTVLASLLNIEASFGLTLIVTIVCVATFTISAWLGIEKGIKRLSTFNVYLAAAFGIFILIAGPGVFILDHFTDSIGFLLKNYIDVSFYADSLRDGSAGYVQNYTVFWFAYCATWALLHSVFAAKISRGRTIREMILAYFLAPTALSWGITGILGGLHIERYITGIVDVPAIAEASGNLAVVPAVLSTMPLAPLVMLVFAIITTVFLITTMDSTTYTIAIFTSADDMYENEPTKTIRLIIALMISGVAIVLMRIGGLAPLEVLSGLMGIPIIIVQFVTVYAAIKMINQDKAWLTHVRKPELIENSKGGEIHE